MSSKPSRRSILTSSGVAFAAGALSVAAGAEKPAPTPASSIATPPAEPFEYCLNTSTIRGANLTIVEQLDVASKVGFKAVEPWIGDIHDYLKKGGTTKDLAKRIGDLGLSVVDAIGFDEWIVDDEQRRAKGLEALKRDMDMLAEIGGKRIAAPPIGANNAKDPLLDLHKVAERYLAVLELGDKAGIQPLVELWGSSRNLSRLGDVAFVAIETRHPKASMLLDLYHLHKGGSDFTGLHLLNGAALHVIHTNDWPNLPIEKLTDAHRVFPGDGVAPLGEIFRTLRDTGFRGYLSLELFNRDYWKQSPLKVAKEGLEKMKEAVKKSLG
ncbi:MAG TPA: sugar phosphate isomerase/epimerase family protein [Tepidisphaeraceae bacterium]|jgi:sugar phosphate isomerase/epimerase|nr:sugar phosphate isomerase/epimerase family protein [Tepidisphaeraceae bacterium]